MWDNYKRIMVNRDHGVVIPTSCRPGDWFKAGKATLAPLYRKRGLLIDKANWVYVWTLYNETLGTSGWDVSGDTNTALHFDIEIYSRNPSGWIFTIPPEIRRKSWLPEKGGYVMCEYSESEMNFWTQTAYNLESILEADSS